MIARVVAWTGRHPRFVLAAALLAAAGGEAARRSLPRDAIPELADPQIVLVAEWMGHSAREVADAIAAPLTRALEGTPGSTAIRGQSMSGMAYLDVVFAAGADIAAGRAAIAARVAAVRSGLPDSARILVGPEASSTGWVYQYALVAPSLARTMGARVDPFSPLSLLRLRQFQDEVLRPALARIPDVAEVASLGGEVEELLIEARPDKLRDAGVAFSDVVAGARAVLRLGPRGTVEETARRLAAAPLGAAAPARPLPAPARSADVARVRVAAGMAAGMADFGGFVPAVGGIVIARRGADVPAVIAEVKRVLDRERARLPAGSELVPVYDRSDLAGRVGRGLARALAEEIAVLVLVVLLFLLHPRSALVPLATLPLVLLLTFAAMWLCGVPATMMSLGGIAIALGLAVDADVVALEACHRRLETLERGSGSVERRRAIAAAASAFAPAILTSLVIAALTFVPVFGFGGETGRLLRPLAFTKTLVIGAAALVALAVAPALRARLLTGTIVPEFANPLTRALVRAYRPFVHFALARPAFTLRHRGPRGDLLRPDRRPARRRIPAPDRRGRSVLHADDDARRPARAGRDAARPPGLGHPELRRGRHGLRQGRPRRDGHRSRAVFDGRDHDPAEATRAVAEGRATPLVFGLGAGPGEDARCACSGPTRPQPPRPSCSRRSIGRRGCAAGATRGPRRPAPAWT